MRGVRGRAEVAVTHRRGHIPEWAVCGAEGPDVVYAEPPTCLGCFVGVWTHTDNEIIRVLTRNSVKDLAEDIDRSIVETDKYMVTTVSHTRTS